MSRSIHPSDLQQKFNSNASLSRSELNSLIQNAKQTQSYSDAAHTLQYGDANIIDEGVNNSPFWFPVLADAEVPEYSVFTIKANVGNNIFSPFVLRVQAANDTDPVNALLTNGGSRLSGTSATKTGLARFIDWQLPIDLRYDSPSVAPVVNEECGPATGRYTVSKDGVGLICLALDTDNLLCKVVPDPFGGVAQRLVKTTVAHPKQSSHPVDLWVVPPGALPGAEILANPKLTFSAYNRTSVDIPANKFAVAIKLQKKHWYIVPWEC